MKSFKIILMISIFLSLQSLAVENNTSREVVVITGNDFEPQTDDKVNPKLLNTLTAVNILNLSGKDCNGLAIERFIIHTLPNQNTGTLYLANGETAVTSNQYLSREESNGLRFDPNENFEGNATFTYCAVDANDVVDSTPATVILPIIAPVTAAVTNGTADHLVHNANCSCKDYETSIPSISKLGILLMFLLTFVVALVFTKRETSL